MTKEKEKFHMQRWEIYTIIGIVAVVVGLGMAGAFYYVTNVAGEQAAVTSSESVSRTAEEKELAELKTEIEDDDALETADIDEDLKDLEAIDLSGV